MNAREIDKCGSLRLDKLEPVLDLGSSPPTCNMRPAGSRAPETHYPLQLLRCEDCTLVQLSVVVDPAEVFPPDYPYSSGNSRELHANFQDLAEQFPLGPDDLVVDIGANDGTLLSKFRERYGCKTLGVEPTDQADKISGLAMKEPFTPDTAKTILRYRGPAKLVTASNVLAHVDNLDDVMAGIVHLLADDGVLVAENHALASLVDGAQWDVVYHEHLRYFDPHSFDRVLERHGFNPKGAKEIHTHGGSFRMWADKTPRRGFYAIHDYDFEALRNSATGTRYDLRELVASYSLGVGTRAWGVGATARATTVINYCGFDVEDLEAVAELPRVRQARPLHPRHQDPRRAGGPAVRRGAAGAGVVRVAHGRSDRPGPEGEGL